MSLTKKTYVWYKRAEVDLCPFVVLLPRQLLCLPHPQCWDMAIRLRNWQLPARSGTWHCIVDSPRTHRLTCRSAWFHQVATMCWHSVTLYAQARQVHRSSGSGSGDHGKGREVKPRNSGGVHGTTPEGYPTGSDASMWLSEELSIRSLAIGDSSGSAIIHLCG
jgi:hypothetical protein